MNESITISSADLIRNTVRSRYGKIALERDRSTSSAGGCCTPTEAAKLGYADTDDSAVPTGANLGLGCGNPLAMASLQPGQTVLDLGSGAGFDCFLAARAVGPTGRVIGVDMTHEMLQRARDNARRGGYTQVEFRLGEIEALPVADNSVDVVISNCVLNLSPEKLRVLTEAFRVLRPGGRVAVSDPVRTAELPPEIANDPSLYCACASGAASIAEWETWFQAAGFVDVRIRPKDESREFIREWAPGSRVEEFVVSATLEAVKPIP
jgi:SAM-dependent methyltransferase